VEARTLVGSATIGALIHPHRAEAALSVPGEIGKLVQGPEPAGVAAGRSSRGARQRGSRSGAAPACPAGVRERPSRRIITI
jgi:hypothetical protein